MTQLGGWIRKQHHVSSVARAYPRRPYACFDKVTGKALDTGEVLRWVLGDAVRCAQWAFTHITPENMAVVSEYAGLKPAEAGRRMGIRLPAGARTTGRSRFEKMVQEYAVTQLRSWYERVQAYSAEGGKRLTAGFRRTLTPNAPVSLKPRLALSATDKQYHAIRVKGSITELDMVVASKWVTFRFKTPSRFLEEGVRPVAPTISVDERERVMFTWYADIPVERTEFSSKYAVGVDVGCNNLATAVVRDITNGEVVEASFMNQRIRSLENKIRRTKTQIKALQKKGKYEEAAHHRKALANRRREAAILVGQEIADLSYRHSNALVAVEDLSHIRDTMRYGRWVRGLVVKHITDMVESNGGRVLKVNAAYTSRVCHQCGTELDSSNYRTPRCVPCSTTWDRDENAAANIAMRAPHKKATATRKKHATQKKRRNSRGATRPLKHPLKKTEPTPKAPQNRTKQHNTHTTHHQKDKEVKSSTCAAGWSPKTKTVQEFLPWTQQRVNRQQAARLFQQQPTTTGWGYSKE